MSKRTAAVGASRSEFDRFEYLAHRLFAVGKNQLEKQRANYQSRKSATEKIETRRKLGFPENLRRFAMKALEKPLLQCSFCAKTSEQVQFLLAGGAPPTAYICGGCVEASSAIIEKTKASGSAPPLPN